MTENLREQVYNFLQSNPDDDPDVEGCVLVGFLVIAEWQEPDGSRALTKVSGDASRILPPWRERMLGFEVAHHWWDYDEEEEEDNDLDD